MTRKSEQFIKDYTNACSNEIEDGCYHEWLTPEQAKAACIIEREEVIKKACEWLDRFFGDKIFKQQKEFIIIQFRKVMEDNNDRRYTGPAPDCQ